MGGQALLVLLTLALGTINCQMNKCDAPADVVFLLDGSYSIKPTPDWTYVKTFVEMLVNSFDVQPYAVHVGVIVYSRFIGDVISLNPYKDKESIKRMVRNLTQPRDDTNTALGIKTMRIMLRTQGRPNKPHFGIVVTDGKSTLPRDTLQEARLAKQEGITMIAVGVAKLYITEVKDIASENNAFNVKDFRSLPSLVHLIRHEICAERSTTVEMTTTTTVPTTTVTLHSPPDIPCDMPADIIFLLDASSSIKSSNWITQKNFVATLINSLHIHPTTMNVGIVVFSTFIGDVVPLSPFKEKRKLVMLTRMLKQAGFGTNTNLGIAKVRELMTSQGRRSEGVPQIAIVITDGQSEYMEETIAQAKAAKDEGIIMIAVGISAHALTSELENIASSRRKVFPVADFNALSGLVDTLKDLICTAITTTQPPPVTTTMPPNIPQLCSGCMIDNGIGYNPYPGDCSKYIQCYQDGGRFQALIKQCPFGLYWNRDSVTCEPASEVDCMGDTCRNSSDGMIHPYQGYGCRAYLTCQDSHSAPMCCPLGSRFIYKIGCIQDSSCVDDCPPISTQNLTSVCLLKEHADKRKYVQSIPGHGSMVRPCADGTVFSYQHCSCIQDKVTPEYGPCRPSVHYTFDQNTQDISGNNVHAAVEGVKIIGHGVGHFDGRSKMNIHKFAGTDFGQKLTIKMRYRMDGTGAGSNANGQIMWLIIGQDGQVVRSGNGQIPVDMFRALQQGTITGTLVRQIVSHVGSIGGSTMIWQIIGLDGSVLLSGFGPITGRTMMQIVNFRPNGGILIKWSIYSSDGSVIQSGQGQIPNNIIDQINRGTIKGTIVKEVSGYTRMWMVVDTSGKVLLSGIGHIPRDIITHLGYRLGGQAGNSNHTLWFVVEPRGKIIMAGLGVIPPSVFKGIRGGTIQGSLGQEIITPKGIIWQIIGLDGKVFMSGSGQIDQNVLHQIANYSPGNTSNEVWYLYTIDGKMSNSGYGKIPQEIFKQLQQGTIKGVLITYILPSNSSHGKWNIIGSDGKVVKSGSGLLTKYVILQYLTSIKYPNGGLIWFIIGPGGSAIESGFGEPPATILRNLAEGILRGSLVKLIVDALGNEEEWQITNAYGQILHTGRGPIPADILKQLQSQFTYEPIHVQQNTTHLLTQWKVVMADGTVHSGVGAVPSDIMQQIARQSVTWTVTTPDGQARTGRGRFPVELVTTYPLPDINFGSGLTEWYVISNNKIIQSGFGEPMTMQPNVGRPSSWTVVKEIGVNGKTSGWRLIDPDGAERDRGSGVVPADIFYRIQYIIDPNSITTPTTTSTTTTTKPVPVKVPHGDGSMRNPVEWYIVEADGSHGRSGFGDVPRDIVEAIRTGQHRGAIVNKIKIGGTNRWQITSSGGHTVSGSGEIPQGVIQSHLMGTVSVGDPEIRPVETITERRWHVTLPDGTVQSGTGEIPASLTQSLRQWKLTLPDGSVQTGTGSVPGHLLQGISSGSISGSIARPDDIQPITRSVEIVTARPNTMTYWKITLTDGTDHSGMGKIPTNFLNQVTRWLVMSSGGVRESGTGNIPEHVLKITNGASFKLPETPQTMGSLIGGAIQSISAPGSWSIALPDGSVNSGTGAIPSEILAKAKGPRVRWAITLQDQSVKTGTGSIPQSVLRLMLPTSNIVPVKPDQGTVTRESSAVSGTGGMKTEMQWTVTQPDGTSKTGTGPIPSNLLQSVQGSSTRWTVIGPDGKPRSGFGDIPTELLQGSGLTSGGVSIKDSGLHAVTGKSYSRWSLVLPDGSVKTGSGEVPADILSQLGSNSQWTVVDSSGQVQTGRGNLPGIRTSGGVSVVGVNQSGGSVTSIRGGKVDTGNAAEVDMFADGRGKSSPGDGSGAGTQSFELNRRFIGPLQYDLVPIRGTSRRIRRMAKRNKKTRSLWQSGHHQALVGNCGGRRKRGASVMILANNQEIIFSLKTTNTAKSVILSMAARPGLNDIELRYDGNYLTGVVNGAKRSIPLSGNIEKRLAALTIGSCDGFPSFHGNMDDFSVYECNP